LLFEEIKMNEAEMIRARLGIWGNNSCSQCGACCYEMSLASMHKPCDNQEIRDGKSYCKVHDKPEERTYQRMCQDFFCGNLPLLAEARDAVLRSRENLRRIARELGTAQERR
jgi:hypothetical protein